MGQPLIPWSMLQCLRCVIGQRYVRRDGRPERRGRVDKNTKLLGTRTWRRRTRRERQRARHRQRCLPQGPNHCACGLVRSPCQPGGASFRSRFVGLRTYPHAVRPDSPTDVCCAVWPNIIVPDILRQGTKRLAAPSVHLRRSGAASLGGAHACSASARTDRPTKPNRELGRARALCPRGLWTP